MSAVRGQPPKLAAPDRQARLLALLREGMTVAQVAAELGVSKATVYNARNRDRSLATAMAVARVRDRHGTESCYARGCRWAICRAAASEARACRRRTKAQGQVELAGDGPPAAAAAMDVTVTAAAPAVPTTEDAVGPADGIVLGLPGRTSPLIYELAESPVPLADAS